MKLLVKIMVLLFALSLLPALAVQATPLDQWASSVIGFSSQWSTGSWSAAQALGPPDTFGYGDISTSWAPGPINGPPEYLTLGFATPVYAYGVTVRETWGNGFVYQIDVLDTANVLHPVMTGISDPALPGTPVEVYFTWFNSIGTTNYLVSGVKIYVDINHNLSTWEEIDAVRLYGDTTAPVPVPPTLVMLGSGLLGLGGWRRLRKG
jgi:hypothetical protein